MRRALHLCHHKPAPDCGDTAPPGQAVGSESYCVLRNAAELAYRAFAGCAFVPDVLPLGPDARRWRVIFRPLANSSEVAGCLRALEAAYPLGDQHGGNHFVCRQVLWSARRSGICLCIVQH